MKKGLILTCVYIILLLGIFIVPPLCERIRFEENNNAFVPALNLCQLRREVGEEELLSVLKEYKESGVTAAVIDDEKNEFSVTGLAEAAYKTGLDICLAVYPDCADGKEETAALLRSGKIKYALLKESENPEKADNLLKEFKESGAVLVLSENASQLSNQKPSAYDEYIEAANGRVMRTYRTFEHLYSDDLDYNAPAFHMINSVIDRNTDFVTITQIKDSEGTKKDEERTQNNIKHFINRMKNLGFSEGKEPHFEGYALYNTKANAAGAALGVLLFAAMVMLLMRQYSGKLCLLACALSAAAFAVYFALPVPLKLLTPTAFALVSALFSLTLVFCLADKKRNLSLGMLVSLLFAVSLLCFLLCGAVLCAMLGGLSYHLNTNVFRGVKICLALPVLYGAVLSFVDLYGAEPLKKPLRFIKENIKNLKIYHYIIFVVFIAAMVMFLLRSGNVYNLSRFELRARNFASETLRQRPRTKEFLIGWPALAAYAFFKNKRLPRSLTWVVSVASCVLFASVINSFCHVFTNTLTIYGRTTDGFLAGVIVSALALAVLSAALKE